METDNQPLIKVIVICILMSIGLLSNAQTLGSYYGDQPLKQKVSNETSRKNRYFAFGVGFSQTNLHPGDASPTGVVFDMDFWGFHFDIASNFAKGEGEYLDYNSSKTFSLKKQTWTAINVGYNIPVAKSLYVTPKLGMVVIEDIYQDNLAFSTYYTETSANKIQAGIDVKLFAGNIYFKAGTALTEIFSGGIGMRF